MGAKRIGIYYDITDSWIGGKYYLDGIINELKKDSNNQVVYLKRSFFKKIVGKVLGKGNGLYRLLFLFQNRRLSLDIVFPAIEGSYSGKKKIYWIPDFQENHYPEFFDIKDICTRLATQAKIAYSNDVLVLSSESANNDFKRLFPRHTCEVRVLSFISSLVNTDISIMENVLDKYNITESYFICSNQLWKHKNHVTVIKAIQKLKEDHIHVLCIFTGKEDDFRNPDYPRYLKKLVRKMDLENEIRFLGFIPREDQIQLLKKALAVVQPSLFEGWNTNIEDSKVLEKLVIASSLPVHKEQLGIQGKYFDIEDFAALAKLMKETLENGERVVNYNYQQQIDKYRMLVQSIFE